MRIILRQPVLALLLVVALSSYVTATTADTGYVYAYFKGGWPVGGHSGVFLSYSSDGLHFESMNDDNPVLVPPANFSDAEDQTRDPSVVYGPDGLFHMVWTSGITTRNIGYSSSPNLKDWSSPKLIDIWPQSQVVDNTWAPEILYDDALGQYQIVFASDLDDEDHRQYAITTSDFVTFSEPDLFYYNNATVIDGMIAEDTENNRFLMAIKDEQNGQKNIRMATGPTAQGPWTTNNPVIVGPGSAIEGNVTEGPSLLKIGDTWHLYYDAYGAGYLGVATSTDPTNPSAWVNMTSQSTQPVGPNAHHGTVFEAPISSIAFDLLPQSRSDLDGNASLTLDDWLIFSAHHLTDLSGLSNTLQGARGDLDGDGTNNFDDFRLFKSDYEALNGVGSFETMLTALSVPEPSTLVLLGLSVSLLPMRNWRRKISLENTSRCRRESELG